MSSAANLFSVSLENNPTDGYIQEQAARANNTNCFISNNSWNIGIAEYTIEAASYDAAVRDALPEVPGPQPVLFVFSAGNNGNGDDGGQEGDPDSILTPATAKNVITVGAVEQFRNITNSYMDEFGTKAPTSSSPTWARPTAAMRSPASRAAAMSASARKGTSAVLSPTSSPPAPLSFPAAPRLGTPTAITIPPTSPSPDFPTRPWIPTAGSCKTNFSFLPTPSKLTS